MWYTINFRFRQDENTPAVVPFCYLILSEKYSDHKQCLSASDNHHHVDSEAQENPEILHIKNIQSMIVVVFCFMTRFVYEVC